MVAMTPAFSCGGRFLGWPGCRTADGSVAL